MLEARGVAANMYDVPCWDAHILNVQMLEMLSADCAHTAELIEKEGFYRWSVQHKQTLRTVAESIMDLTYSLTIYYSILASKNQVCQQNNWMQKGADKLKDAVKNVFSRGNKGGKGALDIRNIHDQRTSRYRQLSDDEISQLLDDIEALEADSSIFRFNEGNQTVFR